jgi:hypothetical protein
MNVIYLNTAEKKPSGGAKVIYNHSSIINNLKIKNLTSEILHLKKTKISKLKTSLKKIFNVRHLEYGWNFLDVSIFKNYKVKWSNNLIKSRDKFNFDQKKDFVIIPEIWAHFAEDFLIKKKIKYAIFVQNGYALNSTSNYKKLINSYKNSQFILSCSENISECIKTVFGIKENKIFKINISVNSSQKFNKKNVITYMPRKLANHSSNVLFFIKSHFPKSWVIKPIDRMNEAQVYESLKESRIFLSFSDMEGLGLPPIEAAILGNKVIGYTGQGGNEYWKSPLFQKIENGNIIKFCNTILKNINLINDQWINKTLKKRNILINKYSPIKEKEKILKMIKLISKSIKL